MLDVFHIAKPQGCDIQTFYGSGGVSTIVKNVWNKPRGVSHVYILMIGAGGNGDNASAGGGSGAVTVWYGAAQNVPDILFPIPGRGQGEDTRLGFKGSSGTIVAVLTAGSGAASGTAGAAGTANYFAASGFYQSIAGQNGAGASQTASTTTFLSGGSSGTTTANYGYSTTTDGYFQLQPIIVGVGGGGAATGKRAGFGCGGSLNSSTGGPGMILIASW